MAFSLNPPKKLDLERICKNFEVKDITDKDPYVIHICKFLITYREQARLSE